MNPKENLSTTFDSSDSDTQLTEIENNLSPISSFEQNACSKNENTENPKSDENLFNSKSEIFDTTRSLNSEKSIKMNLESISNSEIFTSPSSDNLTASNNEIFTVVTNYEFEASSRSVTSFSTPTNVNQNAMIESVPIPNITQEQFPVEYESTPDVQTSNQQQSAMNGSPSRFSLRKFFSCLPTREYESEIRSEDAPPTYSTISAVPYLPLGPLNGRPTFSPPHNLHNNSSFIPPTPPPSYAQAQGIQFPHTTSMTSSASGTSVVWTPNPTPAICPRCVAIVITRIDVHQSLTAHLFAFALFLCGCWPCCILPYFIDACRITDHYCPICHAYLGTYAPG